MNHNSQHLSEPTGQQQPEEMSIQALNFGKAMMATRRTAMDVVSGALSRKVDEVEQLRAEVEKWREAFEGLMRDTKQMQLDHSTTREGWKMHYDSQAEEIKRNYKRIADLEAALFQISQLCHQGLSTYDNIMTICANRLSKP